MPMQRFALRFLIPAEILIGIITFTWGIGGYVGTGRLMDVISSFNGNREWGWSLCMAGSFQVLVALVELIYGRDWPDDRLSLSADFRHFASFFSMIAWVVIIGICIMHPPLRLSVVLTTQAIVLFAANAIICFHTKRLSVLLDPTIKTTQLRKSMVEASIIRG